MASEKVVFNSGKHNLILDVVVTKEKIKGKTFFVAQGIQLDVASQGLSLEEALENIKDAAEIVLENSMEKIVDINSDSTDDISVKLNSVNIITNKAKLMINVLS